MKAKGLMFLVRRRDMSYRLRVPREAQPLQKALRLFSASRQHNTIWPNIRFWEVSFGEDVIRGFCTSWRDLLIWVEFAIRISMDIISLALSLRSAPESVAIKAFILVSYEMLWFWNLVPWMKSIQIARNVHSNGRRHLLTLPMSLWAQHLQTLSTCWTDWIDRLTTWHCLAAKSLNQENLFVEVASVGLFC